MLQPTMIFDTKQWNGTRWVPITVTVEVSVDNAILTEMAYKAACNKTKRSKDGPVTLKNAVIQMR